MNHPVLILLSYIQLKQHEMRRVGVDVDVILSLNILVKWLIFQQNSRKQIQVSSVQ